jgi:hypothetical protein
MERRKGPCFARIGASAGLSDDIHESDNYIDTANTGQEVGVLWSSGGLGFAQRPTDRAGEWAERI